ncbi:putative sensor protein [Liberibacter crescens BT-1]|uniref:histidine kinase n=1 Tax=Liberibacter crescens (strain BT-1) TaxID=1215343 RepID=L0EXG4_LIBCB|nr:PAS domain-containing sensor histidine kinase [Liberibacter crescens]AGA65353.1 putative sensor protein [Liberibacter crescens BT-1]AMC12293.1 alkaline phosphatase [Liberibacter crescens]
MITSIAKTEIGNGELLNPWIFSYSKVMIISMTIGIISATVIFIIFLIRQKKSLEGRINEIYSSLSEACSQLSKYQSLIYGNNCRIVIWDGPNGHPEVIGQLTTDTEIPQEDALFLSFENWLKPEYNSEFEKALEKLRTKGQSFDLLLQSKQNHILKVEGRVSGSCAFARFLTLKNTDEELSEIKLKYSKLKDHISIFKSLFNVLDFPIWQYNQYGQLVWVNNNYTKSVKAANFKQVITENRSFLNEETLKRIQESSILGLPFHDKISITDDKSQKLYHIISIFEPQGSSGIAIDISKTDELYRELSRSHESHIKTLNHISIPIAIFDNEYHLRFYNQSFVDLWQIDIKLLEAKPTNDELLELLRSTNKLPEQLNWKLWKEKALSIYKSLEIFKDTWHLPNGQTLCVTSAPHLQGGAILMFENQTAQVDLQTKYNTLVKVQGETIDHLSEGVAVFGPDGRIKLSNPTFRLLWGITEEQVCSGTHISSIVLTCSKYYNKPDGWKLFAAIITSFEDERKALKGKLELLSGLVLEYSVIPLPNAQTILTFVNVTDSVRAERALTEKNEALRKADEIKNDFVQHVSYELRSPLTNIIGFTDLLKTPAVGNLNSRQSEYIDYISTSSSLLLTLVNDILDLATVDAGIMQLNYIEIALDDLLDDIATRISDKIHKSDLTLEIIAQNSLGSIIADQQRLTQIFMKLLGNAANFAPKGSIITLKASRDGNNFVFSITDTGPGISEDMLKTVFNRFASGSHHGKRGGAGLGLSIVESFVNLHNGKVFIESSANKGTTVTCCIPSKEIL